MQSCSVFWDVSPSSLVKYKYADISEECISSGSTSKPRTEQTATRLHGFISQKRVRYEKLESRKPSIRLEVLTDVVTKSFIFRVSHDVVR
jgi:hypothetical protein